MNLSRGEFLRSLGGTAACLLAACGQDWPAATEADESATVVDFHVHLFGIGDRGTGCFMSEEQKQRLNYKFFLHLLDLSDNGRKDQDYVENLVSQLRESSITQAVLVAQDRRYDPQGRPDDDNTSFYVPNDYLLQVAEEYADLFVPCISPAFSI